LAELLPLPFDVRPHLRLVPRPQRPAADTDREVRFRFPAEEEIWEVSCEPKGDSDETPERGLASELRARSRRAS
jgi:hypothetical protein